MNATLGKNKCCDIGEAYQRDCVPKSKLQVVQRNIGLCVTCGWAVYVVRKFLVKLSTGFQQAFTDSMCLTYVAVA